MSACERMTVRRSPSARVVCAVASFRPQIDSLMPFLQSFRRLKSKNVSEKNTELRCKRR